MYSQKQARVKPISSCDWSIKELPGLNEEEKLLLQNCGISTTSQLIVKGKTPQSRIELANQLQINSKYINKWVALADLARVPSVGTQYCGLLLHAGVGSVMQLAQIPTHRLHKQVLRLHVATMQRRDLCPAVDIVQQWTQQAKMVNY
ncbi:MAG: DUF4332 domain-containing protein [Methylacidiphilales bacterium]|nr:DUF4332 domain-containing protein [Candidatus Methylacidiphilales bacterium]NJR16035.1 DUF4332 domain-containing protein [Calothrix sp. CSU_2_0]